MAEKQKPLIPQAENVASALDIQDLQEISKNLDKTLYVETANNNDIMTADTYFKNILDKLFNDKDISLKTEYMHEDETFTGTKLDFMIKKAGFNFGKTFLFNFEKKRVSQGRKSRIEIVTTLLQREQERKEQEEREFKQTVNM